MRYATMALAVILGTSLAACSGPEPIEVTPRHVTPCDWVRAVQFTQETKEWLLSLVPWPDSALADFDQIAKQNDIIRANCPVE